MLHLSLPLDRERPLKLLCLGAHADDIEIGCGGTILRLVTEAPELTVRWIVFSADGTRSAEARASAAAFLRGVKDCRVEVLAFRDGYFPFEGAKIEGSFEALKRDFDPSQVLTHWQGDAHHDHRLIAELTHNTFRDHLVLEYEIPKYDADLGNPNFFVPLTRGMAQRKVAAIRQHFLSQHDRGWFTDETFMAMARIRGIGCRASEGLAETFYVRKLVV